MSEKILEQMDSLLDELLQIAETMQEISKQVVSEVELVPLQQKQEKLVTKLSQLDETFHKENKNPDSSPLRRKIAEKLKTFQSLNVEFIENLKEGKKLLDVEAPSKKDKKQP